jgi:hypothetical protein
VGLSALPGLVAPLRGAVAQAQVLALQELAKAPLAPLVQPLQV